MGQFNFRAPLRLHLKFIPYKHVFTHTHTHTTSSFQLIVKPQEGGEGRNITSLELKHAAADIFNGSGICVARLRPPENMPHSSVAAKSVQLPATKCALVHPFATIHPSIIPTPPVVR